MNRQCRERERVNKELVKKKNKKRQTTGKVTQNAALCVRSLNASSTFGPLPCRFVHGCASTKALESGEMCTCLINQFLAARKGPNCGVLPPNTHALQATRVEGNQAEGILQSDRCGDRPSSQAETLDGLFRRRSGLTFSVVRKQNVTAETHAR